MRIGEGDWSKARSQRAFWGCDCRGPLPYAVGVANRRKKIILIPSLLYVFFLALVLRLHNIIDVILNLIVIVYAMLGRPRGDEKRNDEFFFRPPWAGHQGDEKRNDEFLFRLPGRPPAKNIQPARRSRNENIVDVFRGPECSFRAGAVPFFFSSRKFVWFFVLCGGCRHPWTLSDLTGGLRRSGQLTQDIRDRWPA